MSLVTLLSLLFFATNAQATTLKSHEDIEEFIETLKRVNKFPALIEKHSENIKCMNVEDSNLGLLMGPVYKSHQELRKNTKCDDLFSETPPPWIGNIDSEDRSFLKQNWWPMCSLQDFNQKRFHADSFYPNSWSSPRVVRSIKKYDFCMAKVNSKEYMSQKSAYNEILKFKSKRYSHVLSYQQKKAIESVLPGIGKVVSNSCCSGFKNEKEKLRDCIELIGKSPIIWCEPGKGSCQNGASFFGVGEAGQLNLGNTVDEDGLSRTNSYALSHELGHACSYIHRRMAYKWGAGSKEKAQVYFSTKNFEALYQDLFYVTGATDQTFSCILDVSRRANKLRFHEESCKGESKEYLEESFADWIAFLSLGPNYGTDVMDSLCNNKRDESHPLGRDSFRCFLKTPHGRAIAEKATGCQK